MSDLDRDAFLPDWARKAFEEFYDALVEKNYSRAASLDSGSFYDAALIAQAIDEYGCALRPFPKFALNLCEGTFLGDDQQGFGALINVYTKEEEGISDLAVAIDFYRRGNGKTELDLRGIYVP